MHGGSKGKVVVPTYSVSSELCMNHSKPVVPIVLNRVDDTDVIQQFQALQPQIMSADSTSLKPHPRAEKSEISRSKRLKTFLCKNRLEVLKRNFYNSRKGIME